MTFLCELYITLLKSLKSNQVCLLTCILCELVKKGKYCACPINEEIYNAYLLFIQALGNLWAHPISTDNGSVFNFLSNILICGGLYPPRDFYIVYVDVNKSCRKLPQILIICISVNLNNPQIRHVLRFI